MIVCIASLKPLHRSCLLPIRKGIQSQAMIEDNATSVKVEQHSALDCRRPVTPGGILLDKHMVDSIDREDVDGVANSSPKRSSRLLSLGLGKERCSEPPLLL